MTEKPLKIYLADKAGFCFGVRRSIDLAFKALEFYKDYKVCSLGPIIHNQQMVDKLQEHGLEVIDSPLPDLEGCVLLIRSHGIHPEIQKQVELKAKGVIDATCPFVKKAQEITKKLYEERYAIFIVGEVKHPEVIALQGYANETARVVASVHEIKAEKLDRVGVVAQTTQSPNNLAEVVSALSKMANEVRVFNTICNATLQSQEAALALAERVGIMLVLGGKNSANTTRLAELCERKGVKTYHIETANEMQKIWFKGGEVVGITAGASTPDWIIQETKDKLEEWFNN